MSPEVYIDTSIIGGYYDEEFEFWTKQFFKAVDEGRYKLAVSDLLIQELLEAPEEIRTFLDQVPDKHKSYYELSQEAEQLARNYLDNNIVGISSVTDCRHIATATVNGIGILTSWNFKHIVNLNKIHLYNGINLQLGYRTIEIRSPRELIDYEE
jgi:predicted nucleic acid-binding protein